MSYGCSVFNRFAIGDNDNDSEEEVDPFEALAKLEEKKKEEKEKSTQKTKESKEAKNKATKKAADESKGGPREEEIVLDDDKQFPSLGGRAAVASDA